ncbi:unnamed protein product [Sphagnum compactum]
MEGVTYFSGFPVAHSGAIKPSLCSRRYQNLGAAKRSKSLDFLLLVCSSSSSSSSFSDANHRDDEAFFFDDVRRKQQDSAIFSSLALSYNQSFLRSSSSSKRFCKTQLCVFRSSRTDGNESSRGRFLVRGGSLGGGGQGSEFEEATASTSSVSELITPEQGLRQTEWREFVEEDWKQRESEDFGDSALALKSNPQEENHLNQRKWQEFEDAVERQDLGRALRALEVLNRFESDTAESSTTFVQQNGTIDVLDKKDIIGEPFFLQQVLKEEENKPFPQFRSVIIPRRECLKMLDTCQSALDLQLVGQAYNWLKLRGLLPSFGKFRAQVFETSEGGRVVTAADMLASAGLTDKNLSPKKWGLSGNSAIQLVAGIAVFSFLVNNSIDIRPFTFLIVALGLLDATYLGGTGQAQLFSLWPPYKRRVLVHEAGHVLVAYLLGCPVRSVVLDAMQALKSGIQGQAGTQFWDESLDRELRQDRLTGATLDMYCIVVFAGIAAEALVYGDAEGGENDENLYKALISQLRPPWGPGKMSNQARWAVLQAFNLLKKHRKVLDALVKALGENLALGSLVETIETTMAAQE